MESQPPIDFAKFQDIFGQLTFLNAYTVLTLGFALPAGAEHADITGYVETAAIKLTKHFPFLGGQVVNEGTSAGSSGTFKIIPYSPHTNRAPVIVKDLSNQLPPYHDLIQAKLPFSMLDGEIVSPKPGIPIPCEGTAPVMTIQINCLTGGLLLTFCGQHNALDQNGQTQVIRLFAKALRGEDFTKEELSEGNRDRRSLVRLLQTDEPSRDHSWFFPPVSTSESKIEETPPPNPCSWTYYRFSGPTLAKLKGDALRDLTEDGSSWVSTDDVLSALVWRSISRARSKRLSDLSALTTINRAANARRFLDPPVSPCYIGHMVTAAFSQHRFDEFAESNPISLGKLASELRNTLQEINDYSIRSIVTLIHKTPDRSSISYTARLKFDRDVMLSSWAGLKPYSTDFGPLGKPDIVRRPKFPPLEGLVYFMPRSREGDIDVAICISDDDMGRLKEDDEWKPFAEWIG